MLHTPQQPTQEESLVIERGMAASNLMNSAVFTAVMSTLMQQYLATLVSTKPHEDQERTACYYATKAIQEIEGKLYEWIASKEQVVNNLNEDTENEISADVDIEDYN